MLQKSDQQDPVIPLDIIKKLYNRCCPTYRDSSGSLSRGGCNCCYYCDANIELGDAHYDDCEWLELETLHFLLEGLVKVFNAS